MHPDSQTIPFSSRAEFHELTLLCIQNADGRIQLFDPDFAVWQLGDSRVAEALQQFLGRRNTNRLQLEMHRTAHLQHNCPRFMALFKMFSHAIECRITPRNLQNLTDSFCLSDDIHLVRRFHADHFRGTATFNSAQDAQVTIERFSGIWTESLPGLHVTSLGL